MRPIPQSLAPAPLLTRMCSPGTASCWQHGPQSKITITFTAETTQDFTAGAYSRNLAELSGSRTVGGVTQNFSASDFVFNTYNDPAVTNMTVSKTASIPTSEPLYPGDQYTYTVTVTNNTTAPWVRI